MFQSNMATTNPDLMSESTSSQCSRCGGSIGDSNLTDDPQTKSQSNLTELTTDSGILMDVNLCDSCASDSGFISCKTNSALSISSTRSEDQQDPWTTSTTLDSSILSSVYSTDSGIDLQVRDKFSELSIDRVDFSTRSESLDYKSRFDSGIEQDISGLGKLRITTSTLRWQPLLEKAFNQDDDGDTHLHLAIIHEFMEVVFLLINEAPRPDFLDILNDMHQSPLHLAVLTKQPAVVRKLITAGATATMRDRKGNTPLHITSVNGDLDCARELLAPLTSTGRKTKVTTHNVQQNLQIRNYDGQMCVHLATMGGHLNILEILHRYGANFNAQEGKSGNSPLYLAVKARNTCIIKFLVETCCVDINAPNFAGNTPVQLAYYAGPEILELLLELGAYDQDPPMTDTDSESDSDYEMSDMTDGSYKKMSHNGAVC